ncbi:MAG: PDZ domain-containing protein [Bacteroidales bacterium]|nr:PDZ domain-containing protein [Candidatus Equibacterium intestinale]
MKRTLSIILVSLCSIAASAQSKYFELGKALDIQNTILKQLAVSYVDTLQFDKLVMTGVDAMLESLDPYTVYFPEEEEDNVEMMTTGNYGGVGSLIKKKPGCGVVITEPYPNSPAVKAGLAPGDTIISIDGKDVFDETSEQSSNRMKGQPGTDVRFKVIKGRTRDTVDVVVRREKIHVPNVENVQMIQDSIGYILLSGFTQGAAQEVKEAVQQMKQQGARRLVLDLRGNGGGLMSEAIGIVSLFVPKGTLAVSSKGRAQGMNVEYRTQKEPVDTEIPLMVMINSGSASASEIVAGALQDLDRAFIAGTRSFGKGLIQTVRPTSYNGAVKITTGKYYTPSGRCVQAIDYSHRNEDGSVGTIPDSLTHEFKTAGGRTVRDGGGITPDCVVEGHKYSRPVVSVVLNDITGDFATNYYKTHPEIAPAAEFALTDAEYEDFISFSETQEFDFRSGADAEMTKLIEAAQYDGLYDSCKAELDALKAKLDITKAEALRLAKDEIKPLLEADIAVKYYFQAASSIISLRSDKQLLECISKWQ